MRAPWMFPALACTLLAGCQHDPFAHTYSTRKPKASDLAGMWTIDYGQTTCGPVRASTAPSSLNLSTNGTFTWTGCPATGHFDSFRVGGGEWSIQRHQEWWALSLSWKKSSFSEELMIRRDTPPYLLNLTVGDPDQGEVVVLSNSSGP